MGKFAVCIRQVLRFLGPFHYSDVDRSYNTGTVPGFLRIFRIVAPLWWSRNFFIAKTAKYSRNIHFEFCYLYPWNCRDFIFWAKQSHFLFRETFCSIIPNFINEIFYKIRHSKFRKIVADKEFRDQPTIIRFILLRISKMFGNIMILWKFHLRVLPNKPSACQKLCTNSVRLNNRIKIQRPSRKIKKHRRIF
jgi:hypothetical protein